MDPRISSMRDAAVAGQFYPGKPEELEQAVKASLPEGKARIRGAIGVMVPHAGYVYSGSVAGAVYGAIELPGRYIIIGPNHTGVGSSAAMMAQGSWRMPLGEVPVDEALAAAILSKSRVLSADATAHVFEHSIEVQLPFLQYLIPEIRIVPISLMLSDAASCREIGGAIARAIAREKEPVLIVASSDMSHYESQDQAQRKDRLALERILALDAEGLLETVSANSISMCGAAPTAAMLFAAVELGASEASLVKYRTSGDVTGDLSQVVGYAGVVVA